jgi:ribosomal protein L36
MKVENVSQNSNSFKCDYIKRTMKIHFICATKKHNLTTLMVKDLAFFYSYCLEGQWTKCKNVRWIGNWVPKQLQPIDTKVIRIAMFDD